MLLIYGLYTWLMTWHRDVKYITSSNAAGHSNLIIGTQQIWQQIDAADKLQRIADEEHAQLLQALQMKPTDDTG